MFLRQCRCTAVRTIQPAVHHHYHHETTRPTILRHSRPDRTQLSDSPLITSLLRSPTKHHTQPSAHRQTSPCSFKRLYIIELNSAALKEMLTLLPNFITNVSVKLTQTSQLLAFCAYFRVSFLVALHKLFEPNRRFAFKTRCHLHYRNDPTAVGPSNTAAVVAEGQNLANKSSLSSGHRHAETSRSVIAKISLIFDNTEEPTGYIIVES